MLDQDPAGLPGSPTSQAFPSGDARAIREAELRGIAKGRQEILKAAGLPLDTLTKAVRWNLQPRAQLYSKGWEDGRTERLEQLREATGRPWDVKSLSAVLEATLLTDDAPGQIYDRGRKAGRQDFEAELLDEIAEQTGELMDRASVLRAVKRGLAELSWRFDVPEGCRIHASTGPGIHPGLHLAITPASRPQERIDFLIEDAPQVLTWTAAPVEVAAEILQRHREEGYEAGLRDGHERGYRLRSDELRQRYLKGTEATHLDAPVILEGVIDQAVKAYLGLFPPTPEAHELVAAREEGRKRGQQELTAELWEALGHPDPSGQSTEDLRVFLSQAATLERARDRADRARDTLPDEDEHPALLGTLEAIEAEDKAEQIHGAWIAGGTHRWHADANRMLRESRDRVDGHGGRLVNMARQLFGDDLEAVELLRLVLHAAAHDHGENLAGGGPGDIAHEIKRLHPDVAVDLEHMETQALLRLGLPPLHLAPVERQRFKLLDGLDAYLWMLHVTPKLRKRPDWKAYKAGLLEQARELGVFPVCRDLLKLAKSWT